MYSKHSVPDDRNDLPPAKRLRSNLADLFLTNQVSGRRAASLFSDAAASGSQHVEDLAGLGDRAGTKKNMHRDLLRKLRRRRWPNVYMCDVRTWNPRRQREQVESLPVLLPHEVLPAMASRSVLGKLISRAGLTDVGLQHLLEAENSMPEGPPLVPIALWIDGTPCNWDRTESVETFAISLPGLTAAPSKLRIPFAVIMKNHCITRATFDDLLSVFTWSLRCLATGIFPCRRHDDCDWMAIDQKRRRLSAKQMPV